MCSKKEFLELLYKIIVLSQLYRSKSANLDIAYDMKNRFLVMSYLFSAKKQSAKTIRIIPDQLGDKQSPSYIATALRMHKILRGTSFYVLPLFERYVE